MQVGRRSIWSSLYLSTKPLIGLGHKEDKLDLGIRRRTYELPWSICLQLYLHRENGFWKVTLRRLSLKDISKCHRFLLLCHWLLMCFAEWFGPFLGKEEKWELERWWWWRGGPSSIIHYYAAFTLQSTIHREEGGGRKLVFLSALPLQILQC